MLYDCLLTMEDELVLVWRRKMSPSSWIFLANRATVVINVFDLATTVISTTVGTQ